MIPQNFKDILGHVEWASYYQSFALLVFIAFFAGLVYRVMNRPKKFYSDVENAPLEDGFEDSVITNNSIQSK